MKRFLLVSALLALIFSITACNHSTAATGAATVEWRIGGSTCDGAGLSQVEVELWDGDELVDVSVDRCEVGQVTFNLVPPGRYDVVVWAYPPAKVGEETERTHADAIYEGAFEGLTIRSNQTATLQSPIALTARKATLYVNWGFSAGMCLQNEVYDVEVWIYDSFGDQIAGGVYDCSLQEYAASLPPEMADQASRGVYFDELNVEPLTIEALGLNDDGRPTYKTTADFQLDHGEVRDMMLTLEPCYDSCL